MQEENKQTMKADKLVKLSCVVMSSIHANKSVITQHIMVFYLNIAWNIAVKS